MQLISNSKKRVVLITGGAIFGFILLQWLNDAMQPGNEIISDNNGKTPDYFMSNFTVTTTHENGEVYQRLSGEQLTHFNSGMTQIEKPELRFNTAKQSVWYASANYGQISKQAMLVLDGDVSIEQINNKFKNIHIVTEQLKLDMPANTVESDLPVTVTTDNGIIRANRMFANLEQQHVQLYSGVKAEYVSK